MKMLLKILLTATTSATLFAYSNDGQISAESVNSRISSAQIQGMDGIQEHFKKEHIREYKPQGREQQESGERFNEHKEQIASKLEATLECIQASQDKEVLRSCMRSAKEKREQLRKNTLGTDSPMNGRRAPEGTE